MNDRAASSDYGALIADTPSFATAVIADEVIDVEYRIFVVAG